MLQARPNALTSYSRSGLHIFQVTCVTIRMGVASAAAGHLWVRSILARRQGRLASPCTERMVPFTGCTKVSPDQLWSLLTHGNVTGTSLSAVQLRYLGVLVSEHELWFSLVLLTHTVCRCLKARFLLGPEPVCRGRPVRMHSARRGDTVLPLTVPNPNCAIYLSTVADS